MSQMLQEQDTGGSIEPVDTPVRADREQAFSRIDSYPYRHRFREIMRTPLQKVVAVSTPVRHVLARLLRDGLSSLYVRPADANEQRLRPDDVGIITERDLLRAIDVHGSATWRAGERHMSTDRDRSGRAFVYLAVGRMNRLKVPPSRRDRRSGPCHRRPFGARPAAAARGRSAVTRRRHRSGREREDSRRPGACSPEWRRADAERVSAGRIAAVIARTRRGDAAAAMLARERMRAAGQGEPPCPYAFAVLGSGGAAKACSRWTRTTRCSLPRANRGDPRIAGSRRWGHTSPTSCTRPACPIAQAADGEERGLARIDSTWRGRIATGSPARVPMTRFPSTSSTIYAACMAIGLANGLREGFDRAAGPMAFTKLLADSRAGPSRP